METGKYDHIVNPQNQYVLGVWENFRELGKNSSPEKSRLKINHELVIVSCHAVLYRVNVNSGSLFEGGQ